MKRTGTNSSSANVPINIPPTTPEARERQPFAPTPCAIIRGSNPNIIAMTVIKIGRKRSLPPHKQLVRATCPLFGVVLHIQSANGGFGEQSYQHDESGLHIDIISRPKSEQTGSFLRIRTERTNDRERNEQTLVKRTQYQIYQHHTDGKDNSHIISRLTFLAGNTSKLVRIISRKQLLCCFLYRFQCVPRTVSGCGCSIDRNGIIKVES